MEILSWAVIYLHYGLILLLCLFGLHRLSVVFRWHKYKDYEPKYDAPFESLPSITVQIPVFNERFVAARVIDCVSKLDYPKDKLHIQVVDDSTDDTVDHIAAKVDEYKALGYRIDHVHRTDRSGFKAGALKLAMEQSDGEFIAIFDADFLPEPDFLLKCIHYFTDEELAMVQARWLHLNKDSNTLTKLQAMMLDSHFSLEQQVRCASNKYFNFNGTAGMWRKSAIIDAGNWSADTLTEDLDLSYRAQLKGWKLVYLNDVGCPAELPSNMNAFKSQQHRWAKGGTQVMKKMLRTVWSAPLPFKTKVESSFHLANNLAYLVMLLDTVVLLIPSIFAREYLEMQRLFWLDLSLLTLSSGGHLVYLYYGQVALKHSKKVAFSHLPWLLILGVQLAFNNARAGLEALLDKQSEFVRTPKSGELADEKQVLVSTTDGSIQPSAIARAASLYRSSVPKSRVGELTVAAIYCAVFVWSTVNGLWFTLPFIFLLIVGFSGVAFGGFVQKMVGERSE